MMLKQTVESPDRKAVFYPGGKNSAVQLGAYQDMVFHRNPKNKISFEYQWNLPNLLEFKDALIERNCYKADNIAFNAQISSSLTREETPAVENLRYRLNFKSQEILSIKMVYESKEDKPYIISAQNYSLKRKQQRPWKLSSTIKFYGFPDEVIAYHQNAEFVQDLNLAHENLFKSIYYLGPLRNKADRLYTWGGIAPESVGYSGENTISAMLASRSRMMSLRVRKRKESFEKIIAASLKTMNLIDEFRVKKISDQRQEYEVKVKAKGSHDFVDLPDVGFGISQVLPVLVQCFYAPSNSIIIMEQPEIHLHPSAQSALADVMINVINSRENGPRNIQLIIETHSEHFLRRLQRRIAEDKSNKLSENVSVYFANITTTPPKLESLEIDMFGNITNWPENFFGDEITDISCQAKAAMDKRVQSLTRNESTNE